MDDWREKEPTEAQIRLIRTMLEFSAYTLPRFDGKTRGEAADYIDQYVKLAHEDVNSPTYGY